MKLEEVSEIIHEELKPSLQKHLYSAVTYGSAARKEDYIPGWSDFDVLVVPNYDFICSRDFYDELGSWYTRARERLEEKGVEWGTEEEIGISVYDKGTIQSGRYCWMIMNFREHLKRSGELFWKDGKDIKKILSREKPRTDEEWSIAYGLWRTRVTASMLDYHRKHDIKSLKYDFKKSTKAWGNFIRNVVNLSEPLKQDTKPGIAKQFMELIPQVSSEDVKKLQEVSHKWLTEHKKMRLEKMTDLFFSGLRIREEVVKVLSTRT